MRKVKGRNDIFPLSNIFFTVMNDTDRRSFLKKTSLGLAAVSLGSWTCMPSSDSGKTSSQMPAMTDAPALPGISLQLYSVRDLMSRDLAGTLAQVAEIGYKSVESAFFPEGVSLTEAAKALQSAGLTVMCAHVELPVGDQKNQALELADAMGARRIVWHGWPEDKRYATLEGTEELAGLYQEAAQTAAEHDLVLGLHNHWWEFSPADQRSFLPFDWLREHLPDRIFFELDTYWIKTAGLDPAAVLQRFGKRAPLLHIKDGPARHDQPMTAVGEGVQDFGTIAAAGKGNTEWMIVEIDETVGDMMKAVQKSFQYLTSQGLAQPV